MTDGTAALFLCDPVLNNYLDELLRENDPKANE